ncbi:12795_t:CDS:2 [Funneliformis geosporum]|uniref:12795_t:CDS:1 n=1 Tax=Funneliformis geosporum TaxID=1117311 RepID=A0A9W4SRN1_9GLOM|nr:12795_t:CDS:2 [Funneliformis geosporum]
MKQEFKDLIEVLILQLFPGLNKDTTRQFKYVKNMTKYNEFMIAVIEKVTTTLKLKIW